MQELQAQGFIRARIDGEVYELDDPPKLDLRRKHTIEAVIDRFKVKPDIGLRLAESFETALRMAEGVARIAFMEDPDQEELLFSDRFACNICGYSLTELEPRLFSFNNPERRLPGMRRSRRQAVFRSGTRRREPGVIARRRRNSGLGSQDRLTTSR